jgi:protein-tyrosine phosphatase
VETCRLWNIAARGNDRTGIFSAILLTELGVPDDVVMEDYLLTNQYLLS